MSKEHFDKLLKRAARQIKRDDQQPPASAEKPVKLTVPFDEAVRKMARTEPPKK